MDQAAVEYRRFLDGDDAGLEALQAAAARLCERLQAEGGVTAAL